MLRLGLKGLFREFKMKNGQIENPPLLSGLLLEKKEILLILASSMSSPADTSTDPKLTR